VFVHGEIWQALTDGAEAIPAGTPVRVERIDDGLVLAVRRTDEPAALSA
jgi:membrane protein implicated in regulation of membrane protease activity